eukprot:2776022-Rhodomonas_salina.2
MSKARHSLRIPQELVKHARSAQLPPPLPLPPHCAGSLFPSDGNETFLVSPTDSSVPCFGGEIRRALQGPLGRWDDCGGCDDRSSPPPSPPPPVTGWPIQTTQTWDLKQ